MSESGRPRFGRPRTKALGAGQINIRPAVAEDDPALADLELFRSLVSPGSMNWEMWSALLVGIRIKLNAKGYSTSVESFLQTTSEPVSVQQSSPVPVSQQAPVIKIVEPELVPQPMLSSELEQTVLPEVLIDGPSVLEVTPSVYASQARISRSLADPLPPLAIPKAVDALVSSENPAEVVQPEANSAPVKAGAGRAYSATARKHFSSY